MVAQVVENTDDEDREELLRWFAGLLHQEENIVVNDLNVDHSYQRTRIREGWVESIAKNFNPVLFRPPYVNRREDGTLWVMDGQHRMLALQTMGHGEKLIPCIVYNNLPYDLEIEIFDTQGYSRPLSPQELFKSKLRRRDPEALIVDEITRSCGFTINTKDGDTSGGRIVAVAALLNIHRMRRAGDLGAVLHILRDGFGTEHGPRNVVIEGVATFHSRYRDTYDRSRLIKVLRGSTLNTLVNSGKETGQIMGVSTTDGVGFRIWKAYNARLSPANQLPDWTFRWGKNSRRGKGSVAADFGEE